MRAPGLYVHYEVSNFALPGRRARHNWGYWTGMEYLGVGLSAHSFRGGRRSWNTSDLTDYLRAVESGTSPRAGCEKVDAATRRLEEVWLGLRTGEGVELRPSERAGLGQEDGLEAMREAGWLELTTTHLRLTRQGFQRADAVTLEVVKLVESARLPRPRGEPLTEREAT